MKLSHFCTLVLISTLAFMTSCGGSSGGSVIITTTTPTWITASWSGGAAGPPNDRTDTEATDWDGSICPASSVGLTNFDADVGFAGLNIINSCTLTVTYGLCVAKGSLTQPTNGLNECATDPFDTNFVDLKFLSITNGAVGDFVNTTEILFLNIFYCSDSQSLTGPPLSSSIACL